MNITAIYIVSSIPHQKKHANIGETLGYLSLNSSIQIDRAN
jgi:hypothetical protein